MSTTPPEEKFLGYAIIGDGCAVCDYDDDIAVRMDNEDGWPHVFATREEAEAYLRDVELTYCNAGLVVGKWVEG